jgi:hypothetical protein
MRGGDIRHSPPARVFFGPLGRMTGMGRIPWETRCRWPFPPPATGTGIRSRRGLFIPSHIHPTALHLVLARMLRTAVKRLNPGPVGGTGPGLCRMLDPNFREFIFSDVR